MSKPIPRFQILLLTTSKKLKWKEFIKSKKLKALVFFKFFFREVPGASRSGQKRPGASRNGEDRPGAARNGQERPGPGAQDRHIKRSGTPKMTFEFI